MACERAVERTRYREPRIVSCPSDHSITFDATQHVKHPEAYMDLADQVWEQSGGAISLDLRLLPQGFIFLLHNLAVDAGALSLETVEEMVRQRLRETCITSTDFNPEYANLLPSD